MEDFMQSFGEFWKTWGPWISVSLIPTLIAGLSISPKTKPAAGKVEKIWNGLKTLLGMLSVVTHKDEPGTFQLPLKMGKVVKRKKKDKTDVSNTPTGPGCAAGLLIIAFSTTPMQMGCSWFKSDTAKQIADGAIQCAIQSVQSNARSLLPTILAILTGKADNWKQQVEAIAKEFGRDATACALVIASQELTNSIPAAGSADDPKVKEAQQGVLKASTFINEKNWTFAEGQ